ncbi:MAG: hypothetical protein HW421_2669 [Ignavibacteria bacterium]|nr:hypothetical protein [Ignavibacteria bacterium]
MNFIKIKFLFLSFFIIINCLEAQHCKDFLVYDGMEKVVKFGMDSTTHWWAITEPFTNKNRVLIDGSSSDVYQSVSEPIFSPDGYRWAFAACDNNYCYIVSNEEKISLPFVKITEITFSPNSQALVYAYKETEDEIIVLPNRKIKVYARYGSMYLSSGGERIAFMGRRVDGFVLNINGQESSIFDEIKPFGFWQDGTFLFAGRSGDRWQIYKDGKAYPESYTGIFEPTLNLSANCAAFSGTLLSGKQVAVLISEEYYEPLISKQYDIIENITLHPNSPLVAFTATNDGTHYVVLSSSEYFAPGNFSKIRFTYDGSELFFMGCQTDCYANINGRKFPMNSLIDLQYTFACKPGTRTIAYSTSSSIVFRYIERKELYSGMMTDATSPARYNWRTDRYEALGSINNRIYLMTCKN